MHKSTLTPTEIENAVRLALTDTLSDPLFMRQLSEEIADRLDGVDDSRLGRMMDDAAEHSATVDESIIDDAFRH